MAEISAAETDAVEAVSPIPAEVTAVQGSAQRSAHPVLTNVIISAATATLFALIGGFISGSGGAFAAAAILAGITIIMIAFAVPAADDSSAQRSRDVGHMDVLDNKELALYQR